MQVGIVVHSETGHTVLLARAIAEKLRRAQHEVDLNLLRPKEKIKPGSTHITFRKVPELSVYDVLLVGGPVWAFNSSPAISAYLDSLDNDALEGKHCLSFVTMGLPVHALNANRALTTMDKKIARKGGQLLQSHAMHWFIHAEKSAIELAASTIFDRVAKLQPPQDEPPKLRSQSQDTVLE